MARSDDLINEAKNPKLCLVRCLCGWTLIFLYMPPLIILSLSTVGQTTVVLSIKDFNITQLQNNFNASNSNQSCIYFKLKLENTDDTMGVYYDNLNLTFSYNSSGGLVRLGNYTIPKFHQGVNKKTDRKDFVAITNGVSLQEISKKVSFSSPSSGVVFRVDLAGAVKFREMYSRAKSKTRKIMAWANVEVDRITGKKIKHKDIKLKHMIEHHVSGATIFAIVMMIIVVILTPCWCFLFLCVICTAAGH